MNLLAFFGAYRLAIELVVLGVLTAALGVQTWRLHSEQADNATQRVSVAEERGLASRANAKESERIRAAELQVRADQQEKLDAKERQLTQERADRVIADAAAGRLLQRYHAAVAAAREAAGSAAPATGSPAAAAADLPADMFSRVLEAARQYRDAAESALSAGELAEGYYDALRAK